MISRQHLSTNYLKLCLYRVLQAFILAYVIERLFWEQRGMTVQLVVFAEIIYSIIVALLEVPTGYLADRFSRKWMMVAGACFSVLEFLILIYATSFWHFAAVVSVAAVGGAATSGTQNALLYDSLKLLGQEKSFEKKLGRLRVCDYGAHMLAALVGGLVAARYGFVSCYWLSVLSTVLALAVTFTLVEPPIRATEVYESPENKAYARKAWVFLRRNPAMQFVLVYGVVTGACLVYVDEFWQLYAHGIGTPVIWFGVISGINCLLTGASGLVAYKLKDRVTYRSLFAVILALFTCGVLTMAVLNNPSGLLFLFIAYGAAGLVEPLVSGYLHHRAPSEFRATVESYQSLAFRITAAVVGLAFGYISTRFAVNVGFLVLGGILLSFLVYVLGSAKNSLEGPIEKEAAC